MRPRTPCQPRLSLLIGVLLFLTGLLASAPAVPRAAATQGTVGQGIHVPIPGYGETWLGAFEVPTGVDAAMSWCLQMWVAPGVGAPPVSVTLHDDPVLAWVIETFADPSNALDQAAIAYTVHQRAEVPGVVAGGDVEAAKQLLAAAAPVEVRERSAAMVATATAQAGPYRDSSPAVSPHDLRYGTISDLGVVSAAGAWVSGLDATVELLTADDSGALVPSDRAVFDLNGNHRADPDESNTWTGSTPDGPLTLGYVATGVGEVVVRPRFAGLRTAQLELQAMDPSRQDNLALHPGRSGGPTERTGPTVSFLVAHGFRVTGVSAVEDAVVDPGEPVCDTLDLQPAAGYPWLSIGTTPVEVPLTATLWWAGEQPATTSETTPPTAVLVTEVEVAANGPGTYRACADPAALAETAPGFLTWRWRVDRSAMPPVERRALLEAWEDSFGLPDETTSVRHTPTVVTSLSVRATGGGLRLVDDLWAEGYPSDHGTFGGGAGFDGDRPDELTEVWFFPTDVPVTDAGLDEGAATLIGTVRRDADNGFETLSSPDLRWPASERDGDGDGVLDPLPGTVVARTVFAGDDRTGPLTTSVADTTEQFTVVPPRPEDEPLRVTTTIQPMGDVAAGDSVTFSDATDVFGTVPDGGLTLTNDLFHWTGDEPICSPETLLAPGDPIAVTEAGAFISAEVPVTAEPGASYGYVETLRNPSGQVVHRGVCGAETETVRVPAPAEVTTSAHADSDTPTVGDELWDTISWAGDIPEGATTTAALFRSPAGRPLVCSPDTLVWTSAPITITTSPGTGDTDRHRVDATGSYGFVETTRAPDGTVLSTGTCGDSSETLTVAAPAPAPAPPVALLLALTGSPLRLGAAVGLALVVTGSTLIMVRRRRTEAGGAGSAD